MHIRTRTRPRRRTAEAPLTGFAEGALPIFVPAEQCEGVDIGPIVTAAPASQDKSGLAYKASCSALRKARCPRPS